jgi:hypothetical protein
MYEFVAAPRSLPGFDSNYVQKRVGEKIIHKVQQEMESSWMHLLKTSICYVFEKGQLDAILH